MACRLPSLTLRKGLPCLRRLFFFVLVGSKSNVSAVFWLRFRMVWALFLAAVSHGLGIYFLLSNGFQQRRFGIFPGYGFAMAWAQNLLRVPNTFFLSLAWWLERRFGIFPAAVSQWLGHKTCWGSAFSHARPKHLFLEFGLVACRLPSLTLRKGLPCLRQPFFLFLVGSKSNVSHFLCSAFFVGSTSNVSAVFWLRFRMVWAYIYIYIFLSNGLQQRRFGIFSAAVSQWLGHKTCWGSAFSHARPKHLFLEFGLVACRFFLCF